MNLKIVYQNKKDYVTKHGFWKNGYIEFDGGKIKWQKKQMPI